VPIAINRDEPGGGVWGTAEALVFVSAIYIYIYIYIYETERERERKGGEGARARCYIHGCAWGRGFGLEIIARAIINIGVCRATLRLCFSLISHASYLL
jgi:hypothetical protein